MMKPIEEFTQGEIDSINLDDYEPFGIDLSEYPGILDSIERICKGEQVIREDVEYEVCSLEELRKMWVLSHPNEVKRKDGNRFPLY